LIGLPPRRESNEVPSAVRAKGDFLNEFRQIAQSGVIAQISLSVKQKSCHTSGYPDSLRGALRHRHETLRRDAVDA